MFPVGGVQQTAIQREKYRWKYVSSRGKDSSLKNLESAVSLFPYPLQLKISLMTEIKKKWLIHFEMINEVCSDSTKNLLEGNIVTWNDIFNLYFVPNDL